MARFDPTEHCFDPRETDDPLALPLSITLQVTRRCNLHCLYCSESNAMPEPSLDALTALIESVTGVPRIILSGGEPTLRRDLPRIADIVRANGNPVLGIATNASLVTAALAHRLAGTIDYVDVTIDGRPAEHNAIRGSYEHVLRGIDHFRNAGIRMCVVSVLLQDNLATILDVCRVADRLGATKLKLLPPIRKERGQAAVGRAATSQQIADLYAQIREAKAAEGWRVKVTLTDWTIVREGHALLIYPTGDLVCSPVPSRDDCILRLGNLHEENLTALWRRYPFKADHLRKYHEDSLLVA